MENYLYGPNYSHAKIIDLLIRFFYLFVIFTFLVNAGEKYIVYILKTSLIILLINTSLIYLDIIGLVDIYDIHIGVDNFEGRLNSKINLNNVNDQNVFGIFCLFFLSLYGFKKFNIRKLKIPYWFIIIYFLQLIILHSSRGSLILFTFGISLYIYHNRNRFSRAFKVAVLLVLILVSLSQTSVLNFITQNVNVANRIIETNEEEGRFLQILATWDNFKKSPIVGVGYTNAAEGFTDAITRSNFIYTQVLASGGIILFTIFFLLTYNLFATNLSLLKNDVIVLSLFLYVIILFAFRRPDMYLGVIAYIVWVRNQTYFKRNYRKKNESF